MEALFVRTEDSQAMHFVSNQPCHLSNSFPKEDIADYDHTYSGASPYHVNYCGFETCQPAYQFGPRSRSSYLLHVVFSGKGQYRVNHHTYDLSAGQIFLIPPGVTTTYQADLYEPWSYGWIGFSGYRCKTMLSQLGFSDNQLVLSVDNTDPLRECIINIMETHKITYANELYRTAEMFRFFAYTMEHQLNSKADSPSYSKTVYAQVAMRYLDNNYMNKIKISQLADYIGIDRSYLTKSFCAEYHVSPQEYLIRLRMEKAEQLLVQTQQPIAVVALNVGYSDALAFSKVFKQRNGISPTQYRSHYTSL